MAGTLCEAVLAMRITGDHDRLLILDAAYTLSLAYMLTNAQPKARALCRLLVDGNRKFPARVRELHDAIALLVKVFEAERDYKNAKVFSRMLPFNFVPSSVMARALELGSRAGMQAASSDHAENAGLPVFDPPVHAGSSSSSNPYYSVNTNMTHSSDPSVTRFLLRQLNFRKTAQPDPESITALADFRNPSNPLSPHFTPFVTLPVPESVFTSYSNVASAISQGQEPDDPLPGTVTAPATARANFKGKSAKSAMKLIGRSPKEERYKFVRMSRDEYTRYWARDGNGNYLGTEPEGSGAERIREGWARGGERSISQLEYVGSITEGKNPFDVKERRQGRWG